MKRLLVAVPTAVLTTAAVLTQAHAACFPSLPPPELEFEGTEDYEVRGVEFTRYLLNITNPSAFPDELFAAAPHLPPCGLNNDSSRTWLDIFDNQDRRLYGFCGANLKQIFDRIWFAKRRGTPPPAGVYVALYDRECDNTYTSTTVPTSNIELQVNNTEIQSDDYITWAPTFSRIRLTTAQPSPVAVVLTNDAAGAGGEILFAPHQSPWPANQTATQPTLSFTLPGNGAWVDFVIAGKFGSPSTDDKDAVIEVHDTTAGGPLLSEHALMVRVRKDANSLTTGERQRFLNAWRTLRNNVSADYITFAELHRLASTAGDEAHGQPAFLPWHRAFLLQVERALQQIDPSVALHYWNWDAAAPNIFTSSFMGAGNLSGAFLAEPVFSIINPLNGWNTDLVFAGGEIRRRTFDQTVIPTGFRPLDDPTQPSSLVDATDYGPTEQFSGPLTSFSDVVEIFSHNQGHSWNCGGGLLFRPSRSSGDPLFFLLHSQVDRQWSYWQWQHDRHGVDAGGTLTFPAPAHYDNNGNWDDPGVFEWQKGSFLDDTMWPWDGDSGGAPGRAQRPLNQGNGTGSDEPISLPMVPSTAFPQSPIANLWPPAPTMVKVRDVIDYLGKFVPQNGLGYAYDDVPYATPTSPMILAASAPPADRLGEETIRAAREGALEQLLNQDLPTSQRLETINVIGALDNAGLASLLAIVADREEADEVRSAAAQHHPMDGALIDQELAILNDPTNGGAQLKADLVFDLARRSQFSFAPDVRQRIQATVRELLDDPRDQVRLNAFRALAPVNDPMAIRLLTEGLRNPQAAPVPEAEAIELLDLAGSVNHVEVIRPLLNDPDPQVRSRAIQALAVDPASRQDIVRRLMDEDSPQAVRLAALRSLSREDDAFISYALELFQNEAESPEIRSQAARTILGRMNYQSVSPEDQVAFAQAIEQLNPALAPSVLDGASRDEMIEHLRSSFPAIEDYFSRQR